MGYSSITGDQSVQSMDNCSFDGTARGGAMSLDGELWIGRTTANRANNGGHVGKGTLVSGDGSITWSYDDPNIDGSVNFPDNVIDFTTSQTTNQGWNNVINVTEPDPTSRNFEIQQAGFSPVANQTKNGVSHYDSTYFTVDPFTGFVGLQPGSLTDLHNCKYIVGDLLAGANYETWQDALDAAPSGGVIWIQEGTYEEDPVITKPVKIIAGDFPRAGYVTPSVILKGKLLCDSVGALVQGVECRTNGDYAVEATGSSCLALLHCNVNGLDHSPIHLDHGLANIMLYDSNYNIATTGVPPYVITLGDLWFYKSILSNTANNNTAPTNTSGFMVMQYCTSSIKLDCSGTSIQRIMKSILSLNNMAPLTISGTANVQLIDNHIFPGNQSAGVVGSGCVLYAANNTIDSSATNVFTGAGTLYKGGNVCLNSSGNNVTTTNNLTTI